MRGQVSKGLVFSHRASLYVPMWSFLFNHFKPFLSIPYISCSKWLVSPFLSSGSLSWCCIHTFAHLLQPAQLCPATPITQTLHTHSGRLPTELHPTASCGAVKSRNYTWCSASGWLEEGCVFNQNRTVRNNVPFKQGQVMAELCALNVLSWGLETLLVKSPTTEFKEELSSFLHLSQSLLLVCQLSYCPYLRELLYLEIIKYTSDELSLPS